MKCLYAPLSYLSLVDDVSNRADHAGSARAKHLFDPLLLQSAAQLAHGQVTLRHLELTLGQEESRRTRGNVMYNSESLHLDL